MRISIINEGTKDMGPPKQCSRSKYKLLFMSVTQEFVPSLSWQRKETERGPAGCCSSSPQFTEDSGAI